MAIAPSQPLSLETFLQDPDVDESPAWEYINGDRHQKPMPKGKHSRIQLKLCDRINEVGEPQKRVCAFPELRCTFGGRSIVPDIAVFTWPRIPFDPDGEVPQDFLLPPDWMIEILSPEQSTNRIIGKVLACLQQGCQLGWLIDPSDRSVLVLRQGQPPELFQGSEPLPVLEKAPIAPLTLALGAETIFGWLKMGGF
ncbi:MAG: Uma2 family endonuclease, partial [Chloroflexaceae bacterium]|nr:Uma2 family endonuclease [Chloroflexaceae bacterium]